MSQYFFYLPYPFYLSVFFNVSFWPHLESSPLARVTCEKMTPAALDHVSQADTDTGCEEVDTEHSQAWHDPCSSTKDPFQFHPGSIYFTPKRNYPCAFSPLSWGRLLDKFSPWLWSISHWITRRWTNEAPSLLETSSLDGWQWWPARKPKCRVFGLKPRERQRLHGVTKKDKLQGFTATRRHTFTLNILFCRTRTKEMVCTVSHLRWKK